MGIVTWASIKCELLPQIHRLFFVPANKLEDLLELAYSILRIRFGDELLILNQWSLANLLSSDPDQITALAQKLPKWSLLVGIAGRERLLATREQSLSAELEIQRKQALSLARESFTFTQLQNATKRHQKLYDSLNLQ